jgi:tetratricopeptide (TPR) repeat protein
MSSQPHEPLKSSAGQDQILSHGAASELVVGRSESHAKEPGISFPEDKKIFGAETDHARLKGQVVSWVPSPTYGYHGYIRCDNQTKIPGLVLVNSTSLRDPSVTLATGDKVEFKPVPVTRGHFAADVVSSNESAEAYEGVDPEDATSYVLATIRHIDAHRYYAIIELPDGRTALLHFSHLQNFDAQPPLGASIRCRLRQSNHKGRPRLEAVDATLSTQKASEGTRGANDLLELAVQAKSDGNLTKATQIYEKIISESPNHQAFLNYAAMKRANNQNNEAAEIFERGIKKYPNVPMLREHAGLLAASVGDFNKATEHLLEGLKLSRISGQSGEKGILLNLARTYNRMGITHGRPSLEETIRYYTQAEAKFGERGLPFPKDKLNFELAKFRIHHHRGSLVFNFLSSAGFEFIRVHVLQGVTCADLVVRTNAPELAESYGLSSQMLVRCMFQSTVTHQDLNSLDEKIRTWGKENECEEGVALLVMASLSDDIQRMLNTRIANRRERGPVIVPISQQEIEQPADALRKLRSALDKWLFRRDLFANNSPVHGDRFFGRKAVLAEVEDDVFESRSVGIFGLRKVGKTSLLHELRTRLSASGDIVLYLDLLAVPEGVTDTGFLYWDLANQLKNNSKHLNLTEQIKWRLGGNYENILDIPQDFRISVAFDSDLKAVLRLISSTQLSPSPKVVLILDEVERLLPTRLGEPGFSGFFAFFSYFRGVAQQTKDLTLIVTAANPSIQEAAQFDGRDNPVFNFFKETYLKLLEQEECSKMISTLGRGMGIRFNPETCSLIYTLTGGHPFITRMFCSYISDFYRDRPLNVAPSMVEDLTESYIDLNGDKDFNEIFERLRRDYPGELNLCLELARAAVPIPRRKLPMDRVRHLKGYQLIRLDESSISLSMDLLKLWLNHNHGFPEDA